MKPLLAHIYEPRRVTYPCYVQPKLNGIRALYQNGRFQSRDELPFGEQLLRHLTEPLLQTFSPETILDGELYVHGWPLQRINAAVTPIRQAPTSDTLKVEYHVFDIVDFTKSFEERCQLVRSLVHSQVQFKGVQTTLIETESEANIFYALCIKEGYEGMMYRLGDCPYTISKQEFWHGREPEGRTRFWSDKDNRCWHLLKRKDWQDDEFLVSGIVEGEGKYKELVGALTCMNHKPPGELPFTVSGGLTDSQRQKYWDHPELIIGKQIKVRYLCLSEAGIPLNPTIEAIL